MIHTNQKGFTLIELLIGMAISSVVGVLMVAAYTVQVRSKNTQDAITDMNQSTRAAFEIMLEEIRMAGLDPESSGLPMITIANRGELAFSMDRSSGANNSSDGDINDPNEIVRYHLTPAANDSAPEDGVNDNIASGTECHLGRVTGAAGVALQPLARNVDAINFVYYNAAGAVIPTPIGTQALRNTIRSIEVTMVARAGTTSEGLFYDFTNNDAYFNLQNPPAQILAPQADKFRRFRLAARIYCRNLGI